MTEVRSPDSRTAKYPAFQDAGTLPPEPRPRAALNRRAIATRSIPHRFAPRWASRPPPYASLRPPDVIRLSVCFPAIVIHEKV